MCVFFFSSSQFDYAQFFSETVKVRLLKYFEVNKLCHENSLPEKIKGIIIQHIRVALSAPLLSASSNIWYMYLFFLKPNLNHLLASVSEQTDMSPIFGV